MNSLAVNYGTSARQYSLVFIAYCLCAVVWIPKLAGVGAGPAGLSAVLLVVSVPVIFFSVAQIQLDDGALRYRFFLFTAMFLILLWGFIGAFDVADLFRSARFFLSIGQGFIFIAIFGCLLQRHEIVVSFRIMVVMLFISVGFSILANFSAPISNVIYGDTDRAHGFFKNPNQFGMILALCVPASMMFLIFRRKKILPLIALIIALAGLGLAGSKTNILISGLLLFLSLAYALISVKRYFLLLFVLPISIIFASYAALPVLEKINPRAAKILGNVSEPSANNTRSVYQRVELWDYSIEVMMNKPLTGEGTAQRIVTPTQNLSHSHNVFLNIGRTIGIPGLVGIIWILGTSVLFACATLLRILASTAINDSQRFNKALLAGACFGVISSVLSNQMSDSFGPSTSTFFWLCVSIIVRRNDLMKDIR